MHSSVGGELTFILIRQAKYCLYGLSASHYPQLPLTPDREKGLQGGLSSSTGHQSVEGTVSYLNSYDITVISTFD